MLSEDGTAELMALLRKNRKAVAILERAPQLKLRDWYLGAGCIAQTVWNELMEILPRSTSGITTWSILTAPTGPTKVRIR